MKNTSREVRELSSNARLSFSFALLSPQSKAKTSSFAYFYVFKPHFTQCLVPEPKGYEWTIGIGRKRLEIMRKKGKSLNIQGFPLYPSGCCGGKVEKRKEKK